MTDPQPYENMRPKRALVFRSTLLAPSETFILDQVRHFQGWKPVLCGENLRDDGLEIGEFETHLLAPPQSDRAKRLVYRICRFLWIADPFSLASLKKLDLKLVHAHFGTSAVDIWPYARALHIPMIVTLHGFDATTKFSWWKRHSLLSRWRRYPERLLQLGKCSNVRFLAVSKAIKLRAIDLGLPEEKIEVCYTGIDVHKFQPNQAPWSSRPRRIIFIGRLVEKKGVPVLLEAFSRLQRDLEDVELCIVGDGPLKSHLQELVCAMKLKNVSFKGTQAPEAVISALGDSRVLCLPSVTARNGDSEGFGMVLLEAQAAGLPVVSSAIGGAEEGLIDGVTGFRFEERDVDHLHRSLYRLVSEDCLAERMGTEARMFVTRKFDIAKCTRTLMAHYEKLVSI